MSMTEHSQKGGTHDVPHLLSDFERTLTPEEREMFLEYKEIFQLLSDVVIHTTEHSINFEKEIIAIAEIFHRLGIPIDGIVKEFREAQNEDDLPTRYQLERIAGDNSDATIALLEQKCLDRIENSSNFFPVAWGGPPYNAGSQRELMVVDWKIKKGDFSGALNILDHIPPPSRHTGLISQRFENHDYFFDGYRALARAHITAGLDPVQEIPQNPDRMCVQLAAVCHAYIDKDDCEAAERTLQTLLGWREHVREGSVVGKEHDQIYDIWSNYTMFAREDYTIIRTVHALALAKKSRGVDFGREIEQSRMVLSGISDSEIMRLQSHAVQAYCAYEAVVTYARLGIGGESLIEALETLLKYKEEFYARTDTPYCALAYAAAGDFEEVKRNLFYQQDKFGKSVPMPEGIRLAAQMAFECGQENVGKQLMEFLKKVSTEQQKPRLRSEYNSIPISFLKEHIRMERYMAQREGRPYSMTPSQYEDILEFNINDDRQEDKAEDCALEHVGAALSDIDSRHSALSKD
ncbi:MAG: hypothetical protein Q8P56_01325 [Candidatus Uhrbacteria bacterium]|nr:hypothetical protein [Candidatus Uhrbacteria bacterium]